VAMSRVCVVTDTGADVDKRAAEAWALVEVGLSRVLTASLRQLSAPAAVQAIDAVEAALAVPLPQDFPRQSPHSQRNRPRPDTAGMPYDTSLIIERTGCGATATIRSRTGTILRSGRTWSIGRCSG
jgi:hypothetical protein